MIKENLKYTQEHEWAKEENGFIYMGITDYAVEQLGDITFIELPSTGTTVNQMQSLGEIESVKAVSEYYAPVSGEIIEVNSVLENQPEILNENPYETGWICKIKISQPADLDKLMNADGYGKYLKTL